MTAVKRRCSLAPRGCCWPCDPKRPRIKIQLDTLHNDLADAIIHMQRVFYKERARDCKDQMQAP